MEIRCEQLDRGSLGAVLHSGFRIRIAGQEGVGGRVRRVYSDSYSVFVCGMSIIQHEGKAVYSVFVIRIPYSGSWALRNVDIKKYCLAILRFTYGNCCEHTIYILRNGA